MTQTPKPYKPKPNTIVVGSKYEATRGLPLAQITKLVRADLKADGAPAAKFSVRKSEYSMGCEIIVEISEVAEPFQLFDLNRLAWEHQNPHASFSDYPGGLSRHSMQACVLLAEVEEIVNQYNRRVTSNEPDDYSNTHFHVDVKFLAGDWMNTKRHIELDRALKAHAPTEPAPALAANDVDEDSTQVDYLEHLGAL